MAKKEVKTDLWVARQLDDSKIKYDAQGSDVKEINDALQSASKRGTGNAGYPEYVAIVKDFVIVIEDKADLAKHQKLTSTGILSVDQKDIADYAVNGAYFYAKHIAQNSSFHGNYIGMQKYYKYVRQELWKSKRRRDQTYWLTWKKYMNILKIHPLEYPRICLKSAY